MTVRRTHLLSLLLVACSPSEPVDRTWFEIRREQGKAPEFTKHQVAESLDTGHGTQFDMGDINGDGLVDIALANKQGVNLLLQRPTPQPIAAE